MADLDIVAANASNRNNAALSLSVTPVSGESLIAFVGIQGDLDTTYSAVFNTSESMTNIGTTSATALRHAISIFYLASPTATTANVAVTFSNAGPFRSNHLAVLRVVNLGSYRTPEGATGTGGTVSDTVTSASGEKVVSAALWYLGTNAAPTAGGDLSALTQTNESSNFYMTLGSAAGAASVSASFGSGTSDEGNEPWVVHSVALQAGGGAAATIGRGLTKGLTIYPRSLVGRPAFVEARRPALVGFNRKLAA